eukprot:2670170-Amphidinium_carterae.1
MRMTLPVEAFAWVVGTKDIERPLAPAKNFCAAVDSLRGWVRAVGMVTTQLEASPDPQRLFDALLPLFSEVLRTDSLFASELAQVVRDSQIKVKCT